MASITDAFTSYTNGNLAGQGNWVVMPDVDSLTVITTSGDKRIRSVYLYAGCYRSETFEDNHYAQIKLDVSAAALMGVLVRFSPGTEYFNGFIFYGGTSESYISYLLDGAETPLGSGSYAINTGDVIKLEIEGTTLRAYRNGSLDTRHNGTGIYDVSSIISSNPVLASGTVAVFALGTGISADDFEANDIAGGATELVVADASHSHTAEAPALTQEHTLAVADAAHAHAAETPTLTQEHTLVVADAAHAHTAGGSGIEVTDDFQSYNTGNLAGQGNWALVNADIVIVNDSGDLRYTGGGEYNECCCKRSEEFSADHYAQFVVDVNTAELGLAVRCTGTGPSDGYYFMYYNGHVGLVHPSNQWATVDDGVSPFNFSNGDVIRFEAEGNYLRCYRNGSLDTTLGGGTGIIDVSSFISTYPALASGKPGIAAYTIVGRGDDFAAGDLAVGIVLVEEEPTGETLVMADGTHAHTAEAPALTQEHTLAVADAAHAHAAETPTLAQEHTLVVADAAHSQTAENITLTQQSILAVADASHGHTTDAIALTQEHFISVADTVHSHTAESVSITQAHVLQPEGGTHAHTADNITLNASARLAIADCTHAHSAENVGLSQAHVLTANDGTHAHAAETPTLLQKHTIQPNECTHSHTADNIALSGAGSLSVRDGTHAHTADNAVLLQSHLLIPSDGIHAHTSEIPTLEQKHHLSPADCSHSHTADNVDLSGAESLAIDDGTHAHSAENVALTQSHTLSVDDASHLHFADNVQTGSEATLIVSDTVHSHSAEEVALTQEIILAIQDGTHAQSCTAVLLYQKHSLIPAECGHSLSSETPALIQAQTLSIIDGTHEHTADNITIILLFALREILRGVSQITVLMQRESEITGSMSQESEIKESINKISEIL